MSIVRPVRTEADYEPALERLDALLGLQDRSPDQQDELEMLAMAIEATNAAQPRSGPLTRSTRSASAWTRPS